MANPEHIAILQDGVEAWNAWRTEQRDVEPDLMEADISQRDFTSIDLSNAVLAGANVSHTILRAANLRMASLRGQTSLIPSSMMPIWRPQIFTGPCSWERTSA